MAGNVVTVSCPAPATAFLTFDRVSATAIQLRTHPNSGCSANSNIVIAEVSFRSSPSYGAGKVNSQGCQPSINYDEHGLPSLTSTSPFTVRAINVINNKQGLLYYGFAAVSQPFQGGTKLVANPVHRTSIQGSGGNLPPDDCSGQFSYDFNARIQSGVDPNLASAATVYCQYWYRDPADPFTTGLTNGLSFTICP